MKINIPRKKYPSTILGDLTSVQPMTEYSPEFVRVRYETCSVPYEFGTLVHSILEGWLVELGDNSKKTLSDFIDTYGLDQIICGPSVREQIKNWRQQIDA